MRRPIIDTDPDLLVEEIDLLLRKGQGPCLSVLVNLDGDSADHLRVKNAIKKAQVLLENRFIQFATWESVNERLEFRLASYDFGHSKAAIGVFVSADLDSIIHFPFKVNECVVVADSFEVRDVLYLRQYMEPYFILGLSHKTISLFKGHGESLKEIRDEVFPIEYHDDHEYARSVKGTSYGFAAKGFENDRSVIAEERLRAPVHIAVLQTMKYMANNGQLVLSGPAKLTSTVKDSLISKYVLVIHPGALTNGHFDHAMKSIWQECAAARRQLILQQVEGLTNLGLRYRAVGLRNVWEAANKGKGRVLFVERDYQREAYIPAGQSSIRLHPPKGEYSIIEDAVDDAIEKVQATGGKVVFVETGDLNRFQNIALTLRYA